MHLVVVFEDDVFATTDMALATLLRGQGLSYRLERLGKHKVEWRFKVAEKDQPRLSELVSAYEQGQTRVEPRRFVREFTATRTELYKTLGKSRLSSRAATA